MVNRGRHRKKKDPYSTILNAFEKDLKYPEAFKCMTVEQIQELLREQQFQGNTPDLKVFERHPAAGKYNGGFSWGDARLHDSDYYCDLMNKYESCLRRLKYNNTNI